MSRIRTRLTYANVMATLAVFIALGGTAVASVIITKNSQVGRGTISGHNAPGGKHPNLIGGSVNGTDLASGAVSTRKIARDAVTRSRLRNGSQFLSDLTRVTTTTSPATSTSPQEATATCPPDTKVLSANADLSGGKDGTSPNVVSHVTTEVYTLGDNAAHVEAYESSPFADTWFVFVNAICAKTE